MSDQEDDDFTLADYCGGQFAEIYAAAVTAVLTRSLMEGIPFFPETAWAHAKDAYRLLVKNQRGDDNFHWKPQQCKDCKNVEILNLDNRCRKCHIRDEDFYASK